MVSKADKKLWDEYKQAWANYQHKRYLFGKDVENLPALIKDVLSESPPAYIDIEKFAEPILSTDYPDIYLEYSQMLELYAQIDHNLALKLAEQAINHPNPDVQEIGSNWQQILVNKSEDKP